MRTAAELAKLYTECLPNGWTGITWDQMEPWMRGGLTKQMQRFLEAAGLAPQPQIGHASTLGYIVVDAMPRHGYTIYGFTGETGEVFPTMQLAEEWLAERDSWLRGCEVAGVIPLHLLDGDGGTDA